MYSTRSRNPRDPSELDRLGFRSHPRLSSRPNSKASSLGDEGPGAPFGAVSVDDRHPLCRMAPESHRDPRRFPCPSSPELLCLARPVALRPELANILRAEPPRHDVTRRPSHPPPSALPSLPPGLPGPLPARPVHLCPGWPCYPGPALALAVTLLPGLSCRLAHWLAWPCVRPGPVAWLGPYVRLTWLGLDSCCPSRRASAVEGIETAGLNARAIERVGQSGPHPACQPRPPRRASSERPRGSC